MIVDFSVNIMTFVKYSVYCKAWRGPSVQLVQCINPLQTGPPFFSVHLLQVPGFSVLYAKQWLLSFTFFNSDLFARFNFVNATVNFMELQGRFSTKSIPVKVSTFLVCCLPSVCSFLYYITYYMKCYVSHPNAPCAIRSVTRTIIWPVYLQNTCDGSCMSPQLVMRGY